MDFWALYAPHAQLSAFSLYMNAVLYTHTDYGEENTTPKIVAIQPIKM